MEMYWIDFFQGSELTENYHKDQPDSSLNAHLYLFQRKLSVVASRKFLIYACFRCFLCFCDFPVNLSWFLNPNSPNLERKKPVQLELGRY